jgi:hypothetical protein
MMALSPQQSHKLMIVYLMLTSSQIADGDITTNQNLINNLVQDVPGASNALTTWLQGGDGGNRNAATQAAGSFVTLSGWGGPNGCPLDINTMVSWLQSV